MIKKLAVISLMVSSLVLPQAVFAENFASSAGKQRVEQRLTQQQTNLKSRADSSPIFGRLRLKPQSL